MNVSNITSSKRGKLGILCYELPLPLLLYSLKSNKALFEAPFRLVNNNAWNSEAITKKNVHANCGDKKKSYKMFN